MKKIDAHQHFWYYHPLRDAWITDDMNVIQRDFLPEDLKPLLEAAEFDGCVAVQSDQSEAENDFHISLANRYDFIKGIVGWVDLQAGNVAERLQHYARYPQMKGFRHVLQGEPQRDLMLQPSFMQGLSLLKNYGFTYDILIYEDQLHYLPTFLAAFPDQLFVLDHLAKPKIKTGEIEEWQAQMESLAQYPNLYCKLSGMVTEADWKGWKKEDFTTYMDVVVKNFGTNRILFGSDWPVCTVAASYTQVVNLVDDYFSSFSSSEREAIFGGNAIRFYNL